MSQLRFCLISSISSKKTLLRLENHAPCWYLISSDERQFICRYRPWGAAVAGNHHHQGLITTTFPKLLVLPIVYYWIENYLLKREEKKI